MTITTWGTFTGEAQLREILAHHLTQWGITGNWSMELQHIPSGFTDNVFLLTITGEQSRSLRLILKEYTREWHKKEVKIYENILSNYPSLCAPKMLLVHDNWLLLEYLPPQDFRPATAKDLPLLADWLVAKHQTFLGKLPDSYAEPLEIQRYYLIDKPLGLLRDALHGPYSHAASLILATSDALPGILARHNALPQTLEHGDLEMQNVMVARHQNGPLRLFDWVNARRGTGLFDINQLLENYSALQPDFDTQSIVKQMGQKLNTSDLTNLLNENRQLMILNKLHFYLTKQGEGHEHSSSSGRAIHDHIVALMSAYLAITGKRHA